MLGMFRPMPSARKLENGDITLLMTAMLKRKVAITLVWFIFVESLI